MASINDTIAAPITVRDPRDGSDFAITQGEYDVVLSFFVDSIKDPVLAQLFTSAIFLVAESSGENVLTLLESLKGSSPGEVAAIMTYYMNTIRSSSTLLGIAPLKLPNYYAARNVLP